MTDHEDEARQKLNQALEEYVASQGGGMVVGWCVIVAAKTIEQLDNGNTMYYTATDDSMAYHSTLGLAQYLVDDITSAHEDYE